MRVSLKISIRLYMVVYGLKRVLHGFDKGSEGCTTFRFHKGFASKFWVFWCRVSVLRGRFHLGLV